MPWNPPIRFAGALLLCVLLWQTQEGAGQAGASHARQQVRPLPAPQVQPATLLPTATPPTPAQRPPQHANVSYRQGELEVAADNSSLNQILREISLKTGIKITGGVTDERVFGTYGPASASNVLTSLLDGTGSNMLLIQSDATSPGELILTPRHGGATPPNPNAKSYEDEGATDDSDQPPPPVQPQQPPPLCGTGRK